MRKKVFGRKFSRDRGSRKALRRALIRALVLNGQIKTTQARAKAIQPEIEKLMTLVRKDSLTSRRLVQARLGNDNEVAKKLFKEYKSLVSKRESGFTRIINLGTRKGDQAEMVQLEWIREPEAKASSKKDEKNTSTKTK